MADATITPEGDSLILVFDPGGPVELDGLTASFGALARMYGRHYRPEKGIDGVPKLYITKLSSGSVIAQIAPYLPLFGDVMAVPAAAVTIGDFAKRLNDGLKAFAGIPVSASPSVSTEDARDLRDFVRPLTGRSGASLRMSHASYHSKTDDREITVEYTFDENEINRAALNIDRVLGAVGPIADPSTVPYTEVMLFFESASRTTGKERGRTRDFAIVPDVSPKALPAYFRSGISGNLKDVMVRGAQNPLANVAYVVDLHAQIVGGEPRGYIVTNVHRTIPLDDDEAP